MAHLKKMHISPLKEDLYSIDLKPLQSKKLVSEYEALRNKNMEDNQAVLSRLMEDLKKYMPQKSLPKLQKPCKSSRKSEGGGPIRRNPSRSSRSYLTRDPPYTRSRRGSVSSTVSSSSSTSPLSSPEKMVVRFGFFPKVQRPEGDSGPDLDDEDELPAPVRKPRIVVEGKPADKITEEDLDLVASFVSDKSYDSYNGSTCHQCRQKTDDMKTICRSGQCFGVRGQFCGPCLRNRYGEDAKEALKNPDWKCPPCRGICNCSFCRRKAGKSCTGILIHLAREVGFSDVNAYLQSLRKKQ